jgi:preprotein translocase subunit Sss1
MFLGVLDDEEIKELVQQIYNPTAAILEQKDPQYIDYSTNILLTAIVVPLIGIIGCMIYNYPSHRFDDLLEG